MQAALSTDVPATACSEYTTVGSTTGTGSTAFLATVARERATLVVRSPKVCTTSSSRLAIDRGVRSGRSRRIAGTVALLLATAGCSSLALPPVVVTPPPTLPAPPWPTPTPWPVVSFDPYATIQISRDGTWRVILPDGTSHVIDPRDVLGNRQQPTGVAGRVLTGEGMPVARAVIVARTAAGEPCSGLEDASLTGPTGFFERALPPGICFVSAKLAERATPQVAVQIVEGRLTVVSLTMP